MSALRQQNLVRKGLDLGFDLSGELVRNLALSKGGPVELVGVVPPGTFTVVVKGMVTNYRDQAIPGALATVGDEKVMVRARELEGLLQPAAGDYLEEVDGFVRRRIIAALLDPTASFWMFQARRLQESLTGRVGLRLFAKAELEWFAAAARVELFATGTLQIDPVLSGNALLNLGASGSLTGSVNLAANVLLETGGTATLTLPVITSFVLVGPTTVATGQTVQYTATLYYADGSTVVPTYPSWGNNGHLTFISAANPATLQGQSPGSTFLQAVIMYDGTVYYSNYLYITVT